MAAADYYLKIDGIEGESNDDKLKKQIEISSFSFGESNSGSFASNSGGGVGKVSMQDFHFTMTVNKASPELFLACAEGRHIKDATLTCRKAGGGQQDYLIVTMADVLVSSYQTGGSGGGDVMPTEQISLNFAKIEVEYKEQDSKGNTTGSIKKGWNLKENKKV